MANIDDNPVDPEIPQAQALIIPQDQAQNIPSPVVPARVHQTHKDNFILSLLSKLSLF